MVFTDISSNIHNLTVHGVTDNGRPHELFTPETKVDKEGRVYYNSKSGYSITQKGDHVHRSKWFEYSTIEYRLPQGKDEACKGEFLAQHFITKALAGYHDPLRSNVPNQLGNGYRLVPWLQMKETFPDCLQNQGECDSCNWQRVKDYSGNLIEAFFMTYMREITKSSTSTDCDPSSFVDDLYGITVDGYLKKYFPQNDKTRLRIFPFDVKKGTSFGEQRAAKEMLLSKNLKGAYATFFDGKISQIFFNLQSVPVFVKPEYINWSNDLHYFNGESIKRNFDVTSFLKYNRKLWYLYPVFHKKSAPILDSIEELSSITTNEPLELE